MLVTWEEKDGLFLRNALSDLFVIFLYYYCLYYMLGRYIAITRPTVNHLLYAKVFMILGFIKSFWFLYFYNLDFEITKKYFPFSIAYFIPPHVFILGLIQNRQPPSYYLRPNYFSSGFLRKLFYFGIFIASTISTYNNQPGKCPHQLISVEFCLSIYYIVAWLKVFVMLIFVSMVESAWIYKMAKHIDIYSYGVKVGELVWVDAEGARVERFHD
ncbi:hypothetical protein CRE_03896 [Caenorhabditis remanei]|uniref:Uncharacterized protein n=1 Tax=Caenorhabditis remanei TaxID=31234 RepID=E3LXQ0_CAERE|nr:hypothetical protein CRE_03896 [Caenorhabditis remanei]